MSDSFNTKRFTPLPLVLAVSAALLTACSTGGFSNPNNIQMGLDPTDIPKPTNKDSVQKVEKTAEQAETDKLNAPSLGAFSLIPKRNLYANKEKEKKIAVDDVIKTNGDPVAELEAKIKEWYPDQPIHKNDETNKNYQFVKAGWIFSNHLYTDDTNHNPAGEQETRYQKGDGYVYYYGEQPTMGIAKGKATYNGHWDFATDAKQIRHKNTDGDKGLGPEAIGGGAFYNMDKSFGNDVGAVSFAERYEGDQPPRQGHHKAVFEADFDNKKLTGTLRAETRSLLNEEPKTEDRYRIEANIKGNRFLGSAIVLNEIKEKTFTLFKTDATNRLEGGFYGPQAQELAGKFLTDDESVFGVFAAKRDKDNQDQQVSVDRAYGSLYVDMTKDKDVNPRQKSSISDFDLLGDIKQISVNNQLIELLPVTNGKFAQQSVDLPTGQKAVITNFGTTDGLVNLGYINRTKDLNKKSAAQIAAEKRAAEDAEKRAAAAKVAEAKAQVAERRNSKAQELNDALDEAFDNYRLGQDQDKHELRKQLIEKVFASYSTRSDDVLKEIDELLGQVDEFKNQASQNANKDKGGSIDDELEKFDDDFFAVSEKITTIFKKGDKITEGNEDKWAEFLEIESETLALATAGDLLGKYNVEDITKAKNQLKSSLRSAENRLNDIISNYEGGELEEDELEKKLSEQVLSAHKNGNKQEIEQKVKKLVTQLKEIIDKDEHGDDETLGADNLAERDRTVEAIVALIKDGDKFDPSKEENWKVFLPKESTIKPKEMEKVEYSAEAIRLAKNDFRAQLSRDQDELIGLLGEYRDHQMPSSRDLANDPETQKILAGVPQEIKNVLDVRQSDEKDDAYKQAIKKLDDHLKAKTMAYYADKKHDAEAQTEIEAFEKNMKRKVLAFYEQKHEQAELKAILDEIPEDTKGKLAAYFAGEQDKSTLDKILADVDENVRERVLAHYDEKRDEKEIEQIKQALPSRIESRVLAYYSSEKQGQVKAELKSVLEKIDAAVKVAIEELKEAGEIYNKQQAALEKLQKASAEPQRMLVELVAKGDKANVDNEDNLLSFLKAGPLTEDMGLDNSLSGFYVMGERTPVSEIPRQGEAYYRGTWHARIESGRTWSTEPGLGQYDSQAKFHVNFDDKSLVGQLIEKGLAKPAFDIQATIKDNTFSGRAIARDTGLYLDKVLDIGGGIIKQNALFDDNLHGAFYGENAQHLAGGFSFDGEQDIGGEKEPAIGGGVFYGTKDGKDNTDNVSK
ncbi:hypothetical protein MOVS_07995 [Moraxella ovis]|uniref:Transferrin-binding protein B n=1 Tax=Moraxella ovis TaxID=29433 RepID=A0A160GG84_9GAMM|nr:transferrin-binding protein-like solute binding protein [Moraxella ovis]ANB91916.1 hypothetical protein MOVS_07995 [Moraxella ovis]SPX86890.1 Transferrin-binding protein 2 precursor [Moraxella ovis]STY87649.1 Transferrin-binding protein 2 precursor [Moraxella ovis]STZ05545.1 Transferrin-binding protein 2 precursor [Moraxella ovis]